MRLPRVPRTSSGTRTTLLALSWRERESQQHHDGRDRGLCVVVVVVAVGFAAAGLRASRKARAAAPSIPFHTPVAPVVFPCGAALAHILHAVAKDADGHLYPLCKWKHGAGGILREENHTIQAQCVCGLMNSASAPLRKHEQIYHGRVQHP